ncbi:MAG: hypothetical protein AAF827_13655 [Cyanobacteria bacterium P01_D01_bin.6]
MSIIGDPRVLDILIEAARGNFALSVRQATAKELGFIRWAELPVETQASSQALALETLLTALDEPRVSRSRRCGGGAIGTYPRVRTIC